MLVATPLAKRSITGKLPGRFAPKRCSISTPRCTAGTAQTLLLAVSATVLPINPDVAARTNVPAAAAATPTPKVESLSLPLLSANLSASATIRRVLTPS